VDFCGEKNGRIGFVEDEVIDQQVTDLTERGGAKSATSIHPVVAAMKANGMAASLAGKRWARLAFLITAVAFAAAQDDEEAGEISHFRCALAREVDEAMNMRLLFVLSSLLLLL